MDFLSELRTAGGEYVRLSSVCGCLRVITTPLCVRLNFSAEFSFSGLRSPLYWPMERVGARGFLRVLLALCRPVFLDRVSGDESEERGE